MGLVNCSVMWAVLLLCVALRAPAIHVNYKDRNIKWYANTKKRIESEHSISN